MKLGAENRTATIFAFALFAVAVFLVLRMWTGGGQPAAAAAPAVTPAPGAASTLEPARGRRLRGRAARAASTSNPLDPRLRLDLLRQSEDTEYAGSGRNIFRAEAEIPKPIEPPIKPGPKTPPPAPVVQGPPPPPPINLKFFGFASQPGEPKKVLLSQGDDVFVASEGDIVNRRYKIMKINPRSVEIEDVLSNSRQTINLTAG